MQNLSFAIDRISPNLLRESRVVSFVLDRALTVGSLDGTACAVDSASFFCFFLFRFSLAAGRMLGSLGLLLLWLGSVSAAGLPLAQIETMSVIPFRDSPRPFRATC